MVTCKKCGGKCKPSKALVNRVISSEFERNFQIASFIDVEKCVKCGHSFIPKKDTIKEFEDWYYENIIGHLKP
jgi:NMD protein affecting ribosome stability and mRNA decay